MAAYRRLRGALPCPHPRGWRRAVAALLGLGLIALGTAGCGARGNASSGRISVVAAFYPLQFVAQRVGGPHVNVTNLVKPGAEPHDLELTPRQVASIADADVVIYIPGFQPAVDRAVSAEARDS